MDRDMLNAILEKHLKWRNDEKGGERANLRDADLRGADLRHVDLCGANLSGANLHGANLLHVDLRGADLRHANLCDANLRHADLCGANLSGANLHGANLSDANLRGANLRGANLRGSNIDYASWPLWCGSFGVKVCKRIFCQLAYHLCRVVVDDEECKAAQRALAPLANQFHRVEECRKVEGEAP